MTDPALRPAVEWIAKYEGFRAHPYLDQGGIPTIGYGCTVLPNGARITMQTPAITQDAATGLLTATVAAVLARVRAMVHVEITDSQAIALASMAYNCGTGALANSTLMRLLNSGETANAAEQFGAWCHVAGRVSAGLVARRKDEAALFLSVGKDSLPTADDLNQRELARITGAV